MVYTSLGAGAGAALCYPTQDRSRPHQFLPCGKQCSGSTCFGPPGSGSTTSQRYGSGSGSFYHQAIIVKKTWIHTVLKLLLDFSSLKNDVSVPSKSNKKEKFFLICFLWASWRSMTKIAGSGTLVARRQIPDSDRLRDYYWDKKHKDKLVIGWLESAVLSQYALTLLSYFLQSLFSGIFPGPLIRIWNRIRPYWRKFNDITVIYKSLNTYVIQKASCCGYIMFIFLLFYPDQKIHSGSVTPLVSAVFLAQKGIQGWIM